MCALAAAVAGVTFEVPDEPAERGDAEERADDVEPEPVQVPPRRTTLAGRARAAR